MFDQMTVWPRTVCDFFIISVPLFISDRVIAQNFPEFHKALPILIGGHVQDRIVWTVDLHHERLGFLQFSSPTRHMSISKLRV